MGIRILDTVTGSTFIFPMIPDKITFKSGTKFIDYEIIKLGDVKIPSGEELSEIAFSGKLPGELRKQSSYVNEWKSPREIQGLFSVWRNKGRKLKITIDDTPIDHGVYLQNYEIEYSGGHGDYGYSISFISAVEIEVNVEGSKVDNGNADKSNEGSTSSSTSNSTSNKTYTVKKGDSLWAIAQKFYGKGSQYTKIKSANNITGTLRPGMVLKIP